MQFLSTRNKNNIVSPSFAVCHGIAADGGLFVPESFPELTGSELSKMISMDYPERSAFVMSKFMTDFDYEELLGYAKLAYSSFEDGDPAPLVKTDDGEYVLELWHGPTSAFKDMALTVLPYLITASKRKIGNDSKTLILVATSGDTGKAAMSGFKDVAGTRMIVFYPDSGVSHMQELQMRTQEGKNIDVAAIKGNFDDAQTAVKTIFNDKEAAEDLKKRGYELSSANSINWGRLLPQIAYYVSAYVDLVESGEISCGEKVNFCVPCGNFGNVLACYYAKKMGLPVGKMIVASNSNNVLFDFFRGGKYSLVKREFFKTISPSMDILVSSNLERLLFEVSGRNDVLTAERMAAIKSGGEYSLTQAEKSVIDGDFVAFWCDDDETMATIAEYEEEKDYLLDTHTAVAASAYQSYLEESGDETPTVIVSTANPYKFAEDVLYALTEEDCDGDAFVAMKKLYEETALEIPKNLKDLKSKKILRDTVIDKKDIYKTVLSFVDAKK